LSSRQARRQKTAISSSTEFIGAVADSRPVLAQHLAAILLLADALGTPPIRSFEWGHCTWSQREPGATNQGLLEYLYSGAALS
jgi:hypothetical protein